jgi:nucleoside-diphosphate-sugar epimerase
MRVFVAGAAGAIGMRLVPQLVARGHQVTASTRGGKSERLRALGAEPVVVDGLDAVAVGEAVAQAEPEVIVHQMTALSGKADLRRFDSWFARTNELRTTGTRHLLAAAEAAGVGRLVVQSYTGWSNIRAGGPVKTEDDPFDPHPARAQTESIDALQFLDRVVPAARSLEGIVLRYGNFYGPGASEALVDLVRKRRLPIIGDGGGVWSWIHVHDAAAATVAAVEHGRRGVYNIADDEPAPVSAWLPHLAEAVGAKPPMRVPVWLGRLAAGQVAVQWMTQGRGASNEKAKRELDWRPAWPSWREGFRAGLSDTDKEPDEPDEGEATA